MCDERSVRCVHLVGPHHNLGSSGAVSCHDPVHLVKRIDRSETDDEVPEAQLDVDWLALLRRSERLREAETVLVEAR
jgi:hypothetical protein